MIRLCLAEGGGYKPLTYDDGVLKREVEARDDKWINGIHYVYKFVPAPKSPPCRIDGYDARGLPVIGGHVIVDGRFCPPRAPITKNLPVPSNGTLN